MGIPGPGCCMRLRRVFPLLLALLIGAVPALSQNPSPPRISVMTREQIIHAFAQELVYVRTNFPMGKTGLKLKNGVITPNGEELRRMMSLWGPAAKPGDLARITQIVFKDDHMRFEINGGPVRKQKWYQRIQIQGSGGGSVTPSDSNANARGSFVDLYFDRYVPEMTGPELKQYLQPVFDFDSKSPLEAYLENVPPKVREAIKNHRVLVGMNREMVIYAKGRPPKKVRERPEETEYEEWIYGDPPQDVDFIRFVGDEVVRVETMKVSGEKIVRNEKEIDLGHTAVAEKKEERPANAPTLRRPGEEMPENSPARPSTAAPPPDPDTKPAPNMDWGRSEWGSLSVARAFLHA
jgi:hypothetical protein